MTRIPVPEPDELRADARELLPLTAQPGREPARTMAVLARQPELFAPFLGWAAALSLNGVVPKREHEIVALRVAWNCNSDFEWGEHAEYARAAGLTDDEIAALARASGDHGWTNSEAALIHAADELCATFAITDATWAQLTAHFDDSQLVELVMIAGQYTMLSMLANAARITLPDGLDPLPAA
jgi:4-carboxymuconolactone decarboxylase